MSMRLPGCQVRVAAACPVLCLVLGFSLRLVGLTRGDSSFVVPGAAATESGRAFYHFHPDGTTLVRAALGPIDPLAPGLTAYGALPVYLLRGVLEFNRLVLGREFADQDSTGSVRYVYLTARALAALVSCLTLWLVWLLGRRWFGEAAGVLAVLMVAAAPMAIQAAHFYTVDGLFTLLVLASLHSLLRALEGDDRRWWLAAGVLTGLAAAVRLAGLSVGAAAAAGLLLYHRRRLRGVLRSPAWLAGLAALLVLLVLQPYLVTDWDLLFRVRSHTDLGYAMKVARGEFLAQWSLVDVHTIPYLHHWTHLWPLGVGWPLTLLLGFGIVHGLCNGDRRKGLLLLWALIHFALIGGLLAKPIRYLLPLLPLLSLPAADLCVWLTRSPRLPRMRKPAIAIIAAALVYGASYGIAFAGIYAREDSRIEAARWIDERIPAGSRIGLEQGAFTMRGMIGDYKHRVYILSTGWLFSMRGYATCRAELNWLQQHFQGMDYLAIIEENRYQQYKAVPDLIPGGAAFYRALVDGELGFDLAHRFQRYPSLGGLKFRDDGSDPTFTAYDHPAVLILQKRDDAAWQEGMDRLRRRVSASGHCVDSFLEKAVSALQAEDLDQSLALTRMAVRRVPQNRIAHLIEANLLARAGRPKQEASKAYHADLRVGDRIAAHAFLATGMSLFELGMKDLAMSALEAGLSSAKRDERVAQEPMAQIYMDLADYLNDEHELDEEAADILLLSTRLHPTPAACNRLAVRAIKRKDYEQSATYLRQSLELDANEAGVHAALGHIAAKMDDPATAQRHLQRALELNPALEDDLGPITVPKE